MVAGSRRTARARGRRGRGDPRGRARHRGGAGRSRRDGRLHRAQQRDDRPRSDYDRAETIEETAELVTRLGGTGIAAAVDHLDPDQVQGSGRADPDGPRPHRRAGQRHLGRRAAQGRPGRMEHAHLGARPRQRAPDPPARHRHPPHHVASPAAAPHRQARRPARRGDRRHRRLQRVALSDLRLLRPGQGRREPAGVLPGTRAGAARRDRGRHHAGMAALGDDARQLRRLRGELARRHRSAPDDGPAPRRLRALRVASIRRARRRRAGGGSRSGAMEPEVGQLRSARPRIRLHRHRRLTARHLAIHRGDPRARPHANPADYR